MSQNARRKPKMTLGLRLMMSMHAAGLTSGKMATKLHVSRPSISGWLYGRHIPNHATLVRWAEICDVDLDWLIHDEPEVAALDERELREQVARQLVAQLMNSGPQSSDLHPFELAQMAYELAPECDILDLDRIDAEHRSMARAAWPTAS